MNKGAKETQNWIDNTNETIGSIASWCNILLVVLVFFSALGRYFFKFSPAWLGELQWHIFGLIFLLGAAYTFKHDKHVRVDVFYSRFSARDKAIVNLIGGLVFLIPLCAVIVYLGSVYAYDAFKIGERSTEAKGLPFLWLIKFAIPIGAFFLLLQACNSVRSSWQLIRSKKED